MHRSSRNQKIKKNANFDKIGVVLWLDYCPHFKLHSVKLYQNTVTPSLKLDDTRFFETVILKGIFVPE